MQDTLALQRTELATQDVSLMRAIAEVFTPYGNPNRQLPAGLISLKLAANGHGDMIPRFHELLVNANPDVRDESIFTINDIAGFLHLSLADLAAMNAYPSTGEAAPEVSTYDKFGDNLDQTAETISKIDPANIDTTQYVENLRAI